MEQQHLKEMQLFSSSATPLSPPWPPQDSPRPPPPNDGPSLDLQLSISVTTSLDRGLHFHKQLRKYANHDHHDYDHEATIAKSMMKSSSAAACVEALKWQAAEQIRLAAMERAYAERVRELTRREMELAQSEFARARHMWERAREEAERAERMKERADTCMEMTCQSCRQKCTPSI